MRTKLTLLGAASIAALVGAAPAARPAARSPLSGLEAFMVATMKDWKMPGTAGAAGHGAMWYFGESSRAALVDHLRFLERSRDLRSAWQYNNLAFVTAGYQAGKVAGSSWEDVVRTRLFEPLDMKRSSFAIGVAKNDPD